MVRVSNLKPRFSVSMISRPAVLRIQDRADVLGLDFYPVSAFTVAWVNCVIWCAQLAG